MIIKRVRWWAFALISVLFTNFIFYEGRFTREALLGFTISVVVVSAGELYWYSKPILLKTEAKFVRMEDVPVTALLLEMLTPEEFESARADWMRANGDYTPRLGNVIRFSTPPQIMESKIAMTEAEFESMRRDWLRAYGSKDEGC